MLEVQEALARLLQAAAPLPPTIVPLHEALGLTLAERVVADRDVPPTDRSAMDGFAVRAADCSEAGRPLRVLGEVRAGQDAASIVVEAGEAVRIFTGSVIPQGADAVVMVEHADEDRAGGIVTVKERVEPGQHVRGRGEDLRAGDPVREPGAILRPAEIAALAAVGRTRVSVVRPPRAAVLSTGDEIVEVSRVPAPHQVRNSNAAMLLAQFHAMRIDARDLGIAGDERGALDAAIAEGLNADLLVLSGGVSVGDYDLVESALIRAGCERLFHNVAMRPGKPVVAARRGGGLVLGLPGNPLSAFTCFQVFVKPALRKLMGHPQPTASPLRAALLSPLRRKPGRLTYHLAQWSVVDGRSAVVPVRSASSGDVLSLVNGNAFIVAPGASDALPAGAEVDVLPWDW
jgi:molybdopterin molybdotransferase